MERRRIEIWVDAPGYTTDHVIELMRKELEDAAWVVFRKFVSNEQGGFVQANEADVVSGLVVTTAEADPELERLLAQTESFDRRTDNIGWLPNRSSTERR